MFASDKTAEIRSGIVQGHHAGPGRFEFVAGPAAQAAVRRAGHVDDDGEGQELKKRLHHDIINTLKHVVASLRIIN